MFKKRLASRQKQSTRPEREQHTPKQPRIRVKKPHLKIFIHQHQQACLKSLERFYQAPFSTLMTLLVLGIAAALPVFLYVLLNNTTSLSQHWEKQATISVYLDQSISNDQALQWTAQLKTWPLIAKTTYISPQQGLAEFIQQSGLSDVIAQLPKNPLPGVIEVEPKEKLSEAQIKELSEKLKALSGVKHIELDVAWVQRFSAIINLIKTGVLGLAFLLGLGVLLVIGNTIRLAIESYHEEIETIKLVGGTDSFIRRPFLYTGIFYGFLGGVMAWILTVLVLLPLQISTYHLANLYNSHFRLHSLGFSDGLTLLALSAALGFLGAWFVVNRHLLEVEAS